MFPFQRLLLAVLLTPTTAVSHADPGAGGTGAGEQNLPKLELSGRLREIVSFSDCKFISGLTCRVEYNGKSPLPSEVFFTEYDSAGRKLGKKTRLVYPHLKAGERGSATFRLRSLSPARIVLQGVWGGPWKDPY